MPMLVRQHSIFGCLPLALTRGDFTISLDASRKPPFGGRVIGETFTTILAPPAKAALEQDIEKIAPELWWAMRWPSATGCKPMFSATTP
jgi:hypothetical protein